MAKIFSGVSFLGTNEFHGVFASVSDDAAHTNELQFYGGRVRLRDAIIKWEFTRCAIPIP